MGTTFRAASIGDCRLTGPEHAQFDRDALLTEARAEMARAGITNDPITGEPITDESIEIGDWRDARTVSAPVQGDSTIAIDEENHADVWWTAFSDADPGDPALREIKRNLCAAMQDGGSALVSGPAEIVDAFLVWCADLPGWNDGPAYAPHPLFLSERVDPTEDAPAPTQAEPTIADLLCIAAREGELNIAAGLANYPQCEVASMVLIDHWLASDSDPREEIERQAEWLRRHVETR